MNAGLEPGCERGSSIASLCWEQQPADSGRHAPIAYCVVGRSAGNPVNPNIANQPDTAKGSSRGSSECRRPPRGDLCVLRGRDCSLRLGVHARAVKTHDSTRLDALNCMGWKSGTGGA
eukprot:1754619-Rhodomonas_salina.3